MKTISRSWIMPLFVLCLVCASCSSKRDTNESESNNGNALQPNRTAQKRISTSKATAKAATPNSSLTKESEGRSPIDGIYVFAGQGQSPLRTLILTRGKLVTYTNSEHKLAGRFWLNLHDTEPTSAETETAELRTGSEEVHSARCQVGELVIQYFDGAKEVRTECTIAIVDGLLWVGVLAVQRWENSTQLLNGATKDAQILGLSASRIPAIRVQWDESKGQLKLFGANGRRLEKQAIQVSLSSLSDLPTPENRPRWFEVADQPSRNFHTAPQPFEVTGTGFALALDEGVADEFQKAFGAYARETFDFRSFYYLSPNWSPASLTLSRLSHETNAAFAQRKKNLYDRSLPKRFTKLENCVIAPWSRCLGPVGQLPMKMTQQQTSELAGKWGAKLTVHDPNETSGAAGMPTPLSIPFSIGRPTNEQIQAIHNNMNYSPNEYGICVTSVGYDCQMGHGDYPGVNNWFPTSATSLTRFYTLPACNSPDLNVKWQIVERTPK